MIQKIKFGTVILVALSLAVSCGSRDQADQLRPELKQVSGAIVALQNDYTVRREFIGALQAPQRVELSFDASGPIQEILVSEGERVTKGQTLAILDAKVLKSELAAAQASSRDLRSRLAFNDRELNRLKGLRSQNFASESKVDEIETQRRSLRAQLDGNAATINTLETRIEKTDMKAPFSADVSMRYFDAGAIVNPGNAILQLLESDELLVRIGMPVKLARTLSHGQNLTAVVEGNEFNAVIKSLGLSVSFSTKTVPIELELQTVAADQQLYDGQIVRLIVPETRQQSGTWIPVESLVAGVRGSWDVYVLARESIPNINGDGISSAQQENDSSIQINSSAQESYRVERRKVNVEYVGSGRAFVSHGLVDGDYLVDQGVQKIASGQLVTLLREPPIASAL